MKTLQTFYKEANVGNFLENNTAFYQGAIAEAKSFQNDRFN